MSSVDNSDLIYPISIYWSFEDEIFDKITSGDRLKTQHFHLPGFPVTYYLTLNYHRINDEYPGISIALNCYCDYDAIEIVADFTYLCYGSDIDIQNPKEIKFLFDDENTEVECFAETEWEDYDSKDICIIISGTFTIKELHSIPLAIRVPKLNKQLFLDNNGKNFTVIAEGQGIKVHKSILEQISPVFSRMLESKWKESIEAKIEFSLLPFKLAQICMDAFYGQKYWRFLDKNEYIQLYQFADQYDIVSLKNAVKNSIILTPQNIIEYVNLVVESKNEELINYFIDYLFICIRYSLSIKDTNSISDNAKIQIADIIFSTPLLKRKIEEENKTHTSFK